MKFGGVVLFFWRGQRLKVCRRHLRVTDHVEDLFISLSLPDNQPFKWQRNGGRKLHHEGARSMRSPADWRAVCHNAPPRLHPLLAGFPTAARYPPRKVPGSVLGTTVTVAGRKMRRMQRRCDVILRALGWEAWVETPHRLSPPDRQRLNIN